MLQKTHFYREYMNEDDLGSPEMNFADMHVITKIISEEFKYLSSEFLHHICSQTEFLKSAMSLKALHFYF
ncbi:hypothetical protein HMPREF9413_4130 [Paenibacillus sp. HGF7]|nr:hypothetical protein HMPREF9413_4130 [Paenibacillus sp. HGF7]